MSKITDARIWLVTAGPDGEDSRIAVGFDAMKNAVIRCIWDGPLDSEPEDAAQMREELDDPDFWNGDFWSCSWAFEDGYLRVQRVTDVTELRSKSEAVAWRTPYFENDRNGNLVPILVSVEASSEPHDGWEPLYTHPAPATVVSDARVETAAEIIWNDLYGARAGAWERSDKTSVSAIQIRATARAALVAALTEEGA